MSYGTIKVNTITFTNNGIDQSVTVSGLVASTSGNLTATGTISGSVIRGGTLVSGATVTGAAGQFTNLTSISGVFTTQVSGATITGSVGQFTSLTGISAGFTTVTGTTANFVTVSGTTVTGTTANFATLSGATVTGTTASFTSGVFTNLSGGVCTITSGVLAVGSVTNPSLSFNGDANTGIYSPNTEAIGFATNGQARLVLDADGQLEAASIGSASTPIYSFGSDPNTGMYSPGADQLAFSTNAVQRVNFGTSEVVFNDGGESYDFRIEGETEANLFFVDASTDRVGIGTSSPATEFEVNGTGYVTDLLIRNNIGTPSLGTSPWLYSPASGELAIATNGSERLRIDSLGRLLVGTSSARLIEPYGLGADGQSAHTYESVGDSAPGPGIALGSSSITGHFGPYLYFFRSRGGSVGSNTSVSSGDNLGTISFAGADGADVRTRGAAIYCEVDGTPGADDMPGRLVFSTTADAAATPTEAMRINNAGELLVGYTADNGAYKLQVNSQIFATSATVATSDGRYKENVATLGGCLDLVKALRPVSFTWKPQDDIICDEKLIREGHNFPDGTQVGFIAQEVQEVLADKPWLGSVIKENTRPAISDDAGNELAPEEQFFGIAEGNLIAVLTNALQEAIAKIETLEAKVAALEAKVAALEAS